MSALTPQHNADDQRGQFSCYMAMTACLPAYARTAAVESLSSRFAILPSVNRSSGFCGWLAGGAGADACTPEAGCIDAAAAPLLLDASPVAGAAAARKASWRLGVLMAAPLALQTFTSAVRPHQCSCTIHLPDAQQST